MKRVTHELQVAVDIGCHRHRVAIGLCDGRCVEEFDIEHTGQGLRCFFERIERQARRRHLPVSVAMEGFNGWARPLDRQGK